MEAAKIGKTSLWKLETGVAVGADVYEAAARVLPRWNEDTPVIILEGGPIPATVPDPDDELREQLLERLRELRQSGRSRERVVRILDDVKAQLVAEGDSSDSSGEIAGSIG